MRETHPYGISENLFYRFRRSDDCRRRDWLRQSRQRGVDHCRLNTGVLLLVGAFLLPEHRAVGLATVFIISLLLAAQFVPKFLRTGRIMPAGMMSILSAIGIIAAIIAWIKK